MRSCNGFIRRAALTGGVSKEQGGHPGGHCRDSLEASNDGGPGPEYLLRNDLCYCCSRYIGEPGDSA